MDRLIDGRGGRLDLIVQAGVDMPTIQLTISQDDGSPYDLTTATVVARASSREATPRGVTMTAVVSDAPNGVVSLGMAASSVAVMPAPVSQSSPPRTGGDWCLELHDGATVVPVLYGEIRVGGAVPTVAP